MGTRSIINFFEQLGEKKNLLVSVYQQFDGYIDGVGEELKTFIKSRPFVNGISAEKRVFNGAGCFVAQFIAKFKTESGGLYIIPAEQHEEYNYSVVLEYGDGWRVCKVHVSCEEVSEYNELIIV